MKKGDMAKRIPLILRMRIGTGGACGRFVEVTR